MLAVSLRVEGAIPPDSRATVALLEHGLVSDIGAGENRGAVLRHDAVTRAFQESALPQNDVTIEVELQVPPDLAARRSEVAVIIRDGNGTTLQSLAGRDCNE